MALYLRKVNFLIIPVLCIVLIVLFNNSGLVAGNPLPEVQEKVPGDNKYHSWDGRFYDNIVQDTKKQAETARTSEDNNDKKLSKWIIVGIVVASICLFCCFCGILFCLCDCVKNLLCCVKNLVCCCCDD